MLRKVDHPEEPIEAPQSVIRQTGGVQCQYLVGEQTLSAVAVQIGFLPTGQLGNELITINNYL